MSDEQQRLLKDGFRDDVERAAWGAAFAVVLQDQSGIFRAPAVMAAIKADEMILAMRERSDSLILSRPSRDVLEERLRLLTEVAIAACSTKFEVVEGPDGKPVIVNDPLATLRKLVEPTFTVVE